MNYTIVVITDGKESWKKDYTNCVDAVNAYNKFVDYGFAKSETVVTLVEPDMQIHTKIFKPLYRKVRQNITNEVLIEVAKIYTTEAQRLGGKPVKAVQNYLGGSYRSAQDYVIKARLQGYLPQTTKGKITIKV